MPNAADSAAFSFAMYEKRRRACVATFTAQSGANLSAQISGAPTAASDQNLHDEILKMKFRGLQI